MMQQEAPSQWVTSFSGIKRPFRSHHAARQSPTGTYKAVRWPLWLISGLGLALLLVLVRWAWTPNGAKLPAAATLGSARVVAEAVGGHLTPIRRLACSGPLPASLRVTQGTLVLLQCSSGVRVTGTAGVATGRNPEGQAWILAESPGQSLVQVGASTIHLKVVR